MKLKSWACLPKNSLCLISCSCASTVATFIGHRNDAGAKPNYLAQVPNLFPDMGVVWCAEPSVPFACSFHECSKALNSVTCLPVNGS